MIISEKFKYLFVGIPFSASSATSKELLLNCGGTHILSKHSNIPLLLDKRDIDLNNYFVFAIYREPLEALFTLYSKMRTDQNNVWTKSKFTKRRGGHISQKARLLSRLVRAGISFSSFIALKALFLPIDTFLTLNYPYLDKIIDYNNLEEEFSAIMTQLGIQRTTKIPAYNQTESKGRMPEIPKYIIDYFVAPHLIYLGRQTIENPLQLLGYCVFMISKPFRHKKWNLSDRKHINSDKHDSLRLKV